MHSQVERVALEDLTISGSTDPSRRLRGDEPSRRELGRRIRRRSRHARHRAEHPGTPRLRVRGAPVHRPESGTRRATGRSLDAGQEAAKSSVGGSARGAGLRGGKRDLRHARIARHMVIS